jgi:hypothetical protein
MPRALTDDSAASPRVDVQMPRAARWAAALAIAGLVLGAVYLMAVRGDALLLDLQALSKFAWCF